MGEIKYSDLSNMYSKEILNLCSIGDRFDNEPMGVQDIRMSCANVLRLLIELRDLSGRSEAGRNFVFAITAIEDACMRGVKGEYARNIKKEA